MRSFRVVLILGCVLAAAVLLGACSDSGDDSLEVQLGVVQSLSGSGSVYGKTALQGIQLAVDKINHDEDAIHLAITLVDDGSDVDIGTAAFQTVAGREVAAIIGPTLSNVALEAMPVAQAASIPVLGATTTSDGIVDIGNYVFQVALTESAVVPATIARVNQEQPVQNAALIFDSSDAFSRSSADAMRKGIEAINGQIVTEVDIENTDIAAALPELHTKSLDTVLITPLLAKSAEVVKALRGDGFQQVFIGGNSFNTPDMANAAGPAVEGTYVGAAWNAGQESGASKDFVAAYQERFNAAPDVFAAQGYSSVYLLLDAVKRAGATDGPALRDALGALQGVETPLGSVTMTDGRQAKYAPVVQRFEGGKLVILP
jgi:branched-chain amino acid transport system substrate-binding protein